MCVCVCARERACVSVRVEHAQTAIHDQQYVPAPHISYIPVNCKFKYFICTFS